MIEQTSFFGLPLKTQPQRRLLVVLYCLLLLAFAYAALRLGIKHGYVFLSLSFALGGLLGGVRTGGPVRPYRELTSSPVQTLNLQGRRLFGTFTPLDEREQTHLHLARSTSYRILVLTLAAVFSAYWIGGIWSSEWLTWMGTQGPALSWILLVYAMSLPQSVLLWTEPNAPTADIIEITTSNATS